MLLKYLKLSNSNFLTLTYRRKSEYSHLYEQGQYATKRIREYFYFIDHQGQLFLDDTKVKNFITCFKDKEFLQFFFKRVKRNTTSRFESHFPYISLCGRERNYLRCDDTPIVYTHLTENGSNHNHFLACCGAGDKFLVPFSPESLCMPLHTGRIYHKAEERFGGIALVKSSLAIELSSGFRFENDDGEITSKCKVGYPTRFIWKGSEYSLTNELVTKLKYRENGYDR